MKKNIKIAFASVAAFGAATFGLSACGSNPAPEPAPVVEEAPKKEAPKKEKPKAPVVSEAERERKDLDSIVLLDESESFGDGVVVDDVSVVATVTNNSSKASDYYVEYNVVASDGTRIETDFFYVNNVGSGQTAVETYYTLITSAEAHGATVEITDFDRSEAY